MASFGRLCWTVCAILLLERVSAVKFDPCTSPTGVTRGGGFMIGLAFWPGGTLADWGNSTSGMHPCNADVRANLTDAGVAITIFNTAVDKLTQLTTSFVEELLLTNKSLPGSPSVITVVAFRGSYRSDPRYIASFDSNLTSGVGFVGSLNLISVFSKGNLQSLQWYNLTCNDCGGRLSPYCLNNTSCAVPPENCTCATDDTGGSVNTTSSNATACDYSQYNFCATGVTLAFQGDDIYQKAFTTAGQIKALNSYSLLGLYNAGKSQFNFASSFVKSNFASAWGSFGATQSSFAANYQDNSGRTIGSANS